MRKSIWAHDLTLLPEVISDEAFQKLIAELGEFIYSELSLRQFRLNSDANSIANFNGEPKTHFEREVAGG